MSCLTHSADARGKSADGSVNWYTAVTRDGRQWSHLCLRGIKVFKRRYALTMCVNVSHTNGGGLGAYILRPVGGPFGPERLPPHFPGQPALGSRYTQFQASHRPLGSGTDRPLVLDPVAAPIRNAYEIRGNPLLSRNDRNDERMFLQRKRLQNKRHPPTKHIRDHPLSFRPWEPLQQR